MWLWPRNNHTHPLKDYTLVSPSHLSSARGIMNPNLVSTYTLHPHSRMGASPLHVPKSCMYFLHLSNLYKSAFSRAEVQRSFVEDKKWMASLKSVRYTKDL